MTDSYEVASTGSADTGEVVDTVDVAQLTAALSRGWRFIVACGASLFFVVMGATMLSRMTFVSTARLYLGEVQMDVGGGRLVDLSFTPESDISSEVEILRSRNFVRRAVLASGGNTVLRKAGWHPPRYWQWRAAGRDQRALRGAREELRVRGAELAPEIGVEQRYEVVFSSDVAFELRRDGKRYADGTLGEPVATLALSLTLEPGEKRRPTAGDTYTLVVQPMDEAVEAARSHLAIEVPPALEVSSEPLKVLHLSYSNASPFLAADFLLELMSVYLKERQAWKTADAAAAETFVSQQLQGMRKSLDATQAKLAKYREENIEVVSASEASAIGSQLAHFREQEVMARLQQSSLTTLQHMLKDEDAPLEAYLLGETDDAVLRETAASLTAARQRLTELQAKFKEAAPEVRLQQAIVEGHLRTVRGYVESRLERCREHLRELDRVIAEQEKRLGAVPGVELGLAQAGRDSEVYKDLYSYLLEQQQRTALIKASTSSKNRILDEPNVPRIEQSPELGLRLSSGVVGAIIGALIILARTFTSSALRGEREVRALSQAPVFAHIPYKQRLRDVNGEDCLPFKVLSGGLDAFVYAEAFRTLRTNLYHNIQRGRCTTIVVTSPEPGDGKTTAALALGTMLAADDKRVLVVDADLRKPSHHQLLGRPGAPGLERVLAGEALIKEVAHPYASSAGVFDSVGFDRGTKVEVLTGDALQRFLEAARTEYDFVILDCASYPLVSDALALSTMVDFVFSIVRLGKTARSATAEHLGGLRAAARNHALVVNNSRRVFAYAGSYTSDDSAAPSTSTTVSTAKVEREGVPPQNLM